jgi:hypothetical protein
VHSTTSSRFYSRRYRIQSKFFPNLGCSFGFSPPRKVFEQIRQSPQHAAPHHGGVERHPNFLPYPPAFGYDIEATQQALEDLGVDVARGTLDPAQISRWFEDHAASA